ncbi:hypothetical protein HPB51_000595 [Rhipicephalus microplus]|uniref:Uncharacterized protein n=1 Tax=Rhipicephalus microplus TaxID=6941 RepID=A0A9J6DEB5_RHIMP|nr:hypothetical protein HPB51_000595 [Rhipicephalus microplus]
MMNRHAEPPWSTRCVFREAAAQVRSVVETFDPVPEWLPILDACVCLTSDEVMESFVYAVAILDSDHDDILECWSAKRTEIDRGAHTATYVLAFPTTGEEISFHVKAEENSPEFSYTLDNDSTPKGGMFYFTDYKDCVIEDLEFNGHQCVLWTRRALKDSVPQPCIDQFVDTCGAVVPKHSRDLCNDGEGDY